MLKLNHKILISTLCSILFLSCTLHSQDIFSPTTGTEVPSSVENMYRKGLAYLVSKQTKSGTWQDNYGSQPGVVGLCVVAMLAHGDDPNHGPYAANIKKGINALLSSANKTNGYMGSSMYNHGFATLALAEAYGAVRDDRIGPALEKAVKLILTSQANNPYKAWRYSPTARDADSTVSGACLVALLAAANAGIHVPEKAIKNALTYYETCQGNDGGFGYTSPGGSNLARTAIGALCYSLAGKKKSNVYKKAKSYLLNNVSSRRRSSYYFYYLYYGAQAFFHIPEPQAWQKWNEINIKTLETLQGTDGGWTGSHGSSFSTASALLSLALNYRYLPIYERQ
jgi:hypothetical protein